MIILQDDHLARLVNVSVFSFHDTASLMRTESRATKCATASDEGAIDGHFCGLNVMPCDDIHPLDSLFASNRFNRRLAPSPPRRRPRIPLGFRLHDRSQGRLFLSKVLYGYSLSTGHAASLLSHQQELDF